MKLIKKYFPNINIRQEMQLTALYDLYTGWNSKINVVSRKDINNLYERHVLHSLGIAKVIRFKDFSSILDVGTGGGFPGIPLAILFPKVRFLLLDSVGKKIQVVKDIVNQLNLENVEYNQARAEEEKGKFDFVVSRAVMPLFDLVKITRKNILHEQKNAIPNGFICLKGGNLQEEIMPFRNKIIEYDLIDYFDEEFFKTKKVLYLPA
jgi:16S rRNA (guanine527-N7)-methyltransferase